MYRGAARAIDQRGWWQRGFWLPPPAAAAAAAATHVLCSYVRLLTAVPSSFGGAVHEFSLQRLVFKQYRDVDRIEKSMGMPINEVICRDALAQEFSSGLALRFSNQLNDGTVRDAAPPSILPQSAAAVATVLQARRTAPW